MQRRWRLFRRCSRERLVLKHSGIATRVITAEEADDPSENSMRLANMHRGKRLEFDDLLIPGLSTSVLPNRRVLNVCPDQISRDAFEQRERSRSMWPQPVPTSE